MTETGFSVLVGKTLVSVDAKEGADTALLVCSDGSRYRMSHVQDCCESVIINDVVGDVDDLIGSPILMAEESTSDQSPEGLYSNPESQTWTFYKLATIKGYVTIRWWGTSNGYYSESVDFWQETTPHQ